MNLNSVQENASLAGSHGIPDDIDLARSEEYALLGALLLRAPDEDLLGRLARLESEATPLGTAHAALARAAEGASAVRVHREYFELFEGVGRSELLPYASYYLTGFLNERPLARLRADLGSLGLQRTEGHGDPEDHLGTLFEIMSGLAAGRFEAAAREQERFFTAHVEPWAGHFFADLENAKSAEFYRAVGTVGRIFTEIESEGFAMERSA